MWTRAAGPGFPGIEESILEIDGVLPKVFSSHRSGGVSVPVSPESFKTSQSDRRVPQGSKRMGRASG